jgi:hypothetical protein
MLRERKLYGVTLWPDETTSDRLEMRAAASAPWLTTLQVLLLLATLLLGLGLFFFAGAAEAPVLPGLKVMAAPVREHDNRAVIPPGEAPPAGGVHHDVWLNCGVYRRPVDAAKASHSLEHGAVWVTYRDDLAPVELAALEERVQGEAYLILSPYPSQRSPIVLTAWGVQLELSSAADARIDAFIQHFRLGPTAPESGGACSGGTGLPLGGAGELPS